MKDINTNTEINTQEEAIEIKAEQGFNEFGGPRIVRRLLNVIPVDIEALLKELDEEV
ncbi:hypothetical protein [Bdellovibrio sp. HCB337]|uniref:hypothetical protein n=1 Tax=Bdellovibrio sp. HCB337 TaxID=3394358 RepID=UPI0039A5DADE